MRLYLAPPPHGPGTETSMRVEKVLYAACELAVKEEKPLTTAHLQQALLDETEGPHWQLLPKEAQAGAAGVTVVKKYARALKKLAQS